MTNAELNQLLIGGEQHRDLLTEDSWLFKALRFLRLL